MFLAMESPTPFDTDAPLGNRRAIIRRNPDDVDEIEMIEACWGSNPRFSGGASYRFIRAEGQLFPSHRCLIVASEFHMSVGGKQYRVTRDDGNFFYLAGIWEEPMGDWPVSYRVVTVAANPEVALHQDRQGAMIARWQRMHWLDGTKPEAELLVTPHAGTFFVEEIGAPRSRQRSLAL
jgi:putative SOS response-associated peptidase YedK